jgi:Mor family transcriptional regulator
LNDDKIRNIREQHAGGESLAALARHYMVAPTTIRAIILNKHWRHVKGRFLSVRI